MQLLDILRWASLVIWAILAVWLFASATRSQFGRADHQDSNWAIAWFVGAWQVMWGLRNVTAGPSLEGPNYYGTCGLHLFGIILALGILRRRWVYMGWKL